MQIRAYFAKPPVLEELRGLQERLKGVCELFPESMPEDYEVLIEGRPTEEMLSAPSLRAVIVPFAGVPPTTVELLRKRPELSLHNLHHNAADTAELALALMLAAGKEVVSMDRDFRRNDWSRSYGPSSVFSFDGKTALVLGFGQIGRRVARMLSSLGMRVLATRTSAEVHRDEGMEIWPASRLHELLPQANVLMITLPLTAETTGLLGATELRLLPQGSILVNVARAAIVDEEALFNALKSGRLHSAGLDVWYRYPKSETVGDTSNTAPSRFPFAELDNVVMSPHRGGTTMDTEARRMDALEALLREIAAGNEASNRVDLEKGY